MAYSGSPEGKTVTTGKRNQTIADGMAPGSITLPVKPYSFSPVSRGERDTTLSAGGSASPGKKVG